MKKFFIKTSIFSFLIFFTIFSVIYLLPVSKDKFLAASIDKHKLLAETQQPRIIFTGDSNLAFGLDSSLVKKSTGYNIINMGLHGGLGLVYWMDELKPYLHNGDVVIFILDYQSFKWKGEGLNPVIEVTIFNPKVLLYYSLESYRNYLISLPLTFQRRIGGIFSGSKDEAFNKRSSFNEFGDNVGHLNQKAPAFKAAPRVLPKKMSAEMTALFNKFHEEWSKKGVDIYISFPPLYEENRKKQIKELSILFANMKSSLKPKLIGHPADFIYPRKYFFDNIFHLDVVGREIRTKKLIQRMKEFKKFVPGNGRK